jgi:hypothetical protein
VNVAVMVVVVVPAPRHLRTGRGTLKRRHGFQQTFQCVGIHTDASSCFKMVL